MNESLITLREWGDRTYGESVPTINTLRKWARTKMIAPHPKKHGREYFVRPNAQFINQAD